MMHTTDSGTPPPVYHEAVNLSKYQTSQLLISRHNMLFWLVTYEYIKSKLFSAEILEWTDSTCTYNGDMLLLVT